MIAMVNTRNSYNTKSIPLHRKRDYEFIFEDYELAFPKVQLAKIAHDWNSGKEIEQISIEQKRHEIEILLALVHLASKRKIKRPFAYRIGDKNDNVI